MLNKIKLNLKHKIYIKKIAQSKYFDADFYVARYSDVKNSGFSPAEHYYSIGWKEGRNPSTKFDTTFYISDNQDVKDIGINPLLHFILSGKTERRLPLPVMQYSPIIEAEINSPIERSPTEIIEEVEEVIQADVIEHEYSPLHLLLKDSPVFSSEYYHSHYPDVTGCPITHYIEHGCKEGRNPSHEFNTNYYLENNLDVANSQMNPLQHWLLHGQGEGRKTRVKYVDPILRESINTPSIIFVSHEASETGAPAVLLSLMQWLKDNTKINFSIVVGASGPWNQKFIDIAPTFFFDHPHDEDDIRKFCGDHVQSVYINTIAAATYANVLSFLHAEFITHVHEMENVFKVFDNEVNILKDICKKYIAVSPGSVDSINKRFSDIDLKFLKPFINQYKQVENTEHPAANKKIIFGCGAVEKRKGFDIFCEVAKNLKAQNINDIEMHWIGSDVDKDLNAAQTINECGVETIVKFIGPKANPRDYFKHGDLFLLTSREDPYPLVCMEAAEFELPVICFDGEAGGMHTFVEDNAGLVVPYLDVEKMSEAVKTLVLDSTKAQKMGKLAKQKVTERHYVGVIAPQILDFLPLPAKLGSENPLDNYKALIKQSEIVSFDIFDTLVTREFSAPEVVFDVAEHHHTKTESGILSLFEERMKTAGKVLGSHKGKVDDISIDEIYEQMPMYRDSKIEKQTEIDVCITHALGKQLYDYARELGKKVFITSDMYLDRDTIEKILIKNGFDYWDEFFLSSERRKKKDTGKLFKEVKNAATKSGVEPHNILHIGDNWIGDIKCARAAGISAVRFSPLYESSNKLITLLPEQTLSQNARIWDSFSTQATRIWAEENPELSSDFYTKLGFEVTGPLASMMAMHSKQLADAENISKIIFMARDGRVIKKAFDVLYENEIASGHYQSEYLHLSRASVVPATFEEKLTSNDLYFLIEGLHLAEKPISYFLKKANLDSSNKKIQGKVKSFFKSVDYVPNWGDFAQLSAMLETLSLDIYAANESHRKGLYQYLQDNGVFDESKVMVVDVGWLLNIQSRLANFVKSSGGKTQIVGSYVGTRERINKSLQHSSLLYNLGEPSVYSKFLEDNVTLFEVLFSSPEPSAAAITLKEGKVDLSLKPLGMPLPKEYIVAQKLQMGAEDYFDKLAAAQKRYLPKVISTDYFYNIFEALVKNESDIAKAELGNFEVRLGGHHEFVAYQSLIKGERFVEYKIKPTDEYFDPIYYSVDVPKESVLFVTSAGLTNGSTRYRALNVAEWMQHHDINAVVIHSQTPTQIAQELIRQADKVVFQRCFAEQGHVGKFLKIARNSNKKCIGEMDDLVFPEHVASIGSVKGGEWNIDQAMFVATAYEKFLMEMDSCIVSTIALKEYIEGKYDKKCQIYPNRISASKVRAPLDKKGPLKLIYASGTYSHKEDFELIEKPLYEFLKDNPDVNLSILGATQSTERVLALPNVSSYPLLAYDAMLNFIAKHHVMLVPLVDDVFNNAKSNVKFVEAGAVGVPVIASNVREFLSSINDGTNGVISLNNLDYRKVLDNLTINKINKLNCKLHETLLNQFNTRSLK